jgi:hypothetical protein
VIFIDLGTQALVDSPISVKGLSLGSAPFIPSATSRGPSGADTVKTVELHRDSDEIGVLSAQEKREGKLACFNQRPFLVYCQYGQ